MTTNINDARKISLNKRKEKREERTMILLGYLKLNPGKTVYDLQKHFNWPIGSIHSIIKELEEDLHLKTEIVTEKNRKKILYSLRSLDDFIRDYFNGRTLLVPGILRSARNALGKGHPIKIELKDGVIDVTPDMDLDEIIEKHEIVLDLED